MSRLPFLFIGSGMAGFVMFHAASLLSLFGWLTEGLRGPSGWFHVHLFVLGWATMLAMGAVYQLINVILQRNLYSEKLGYVHYAVFTVGLAGLLYGFHQGRTLWIGAFAVLVFAGILMFAWNIAVTLRQAAQWNAITISAACSVLYLVLTGVTGMAMGLYFATGYGGQLHDRLFGAHIWLGTTGWFGLLIIGFSYKMLPMFYLAHHYPTRLQTVTLAVWNAGVLAGAASFLTGGGTWLLQLGLLFLAAAAIVYNVHLLQIRKSRHKRHPGSGIRWSMYGNHAFAVFAVVLLIGSVLFPQHMLDAKSVMLAGWIYLSGWVSFTILSYSSKIVPFLWWTHKYGKRVGMPGTPTMAGMLNDGKVNAGLAAVAVSGLLALAGLAMDSAAIVAIGGTAFSICSVAYIGLIALVFRR